MKLLSVLAISLTMASSTFAQVSYSKDVQVEPGVNQVEQLSAFVGTVMSTKAQVAIGVLPKCSDVQVTIGMANSLSRLALVSPADASEEVANQIDELAYQVEALIKDAKADDCAPPPNDKCCQVNTDPTASDACNPKTGADCKLVGRRGAPQQCASGATPC